MDGARGTEWGPGNEPRAVCPKRPSIFFAPLSLHSHSSRSLKEHNLTDHALPCITLSRTTSGFESSRGLQAQRSAWLLTIPSVATHSPYWYPHPFWLAGLLHFPLSRLGIRELID